MKFTDVKQWLAGLLLMSLTGLMSAAGITEVQIKASGSGASEELAIRNALVNAVSKGSGVSVDSQSVVNTSVEKHQSSDAGSDVDAVTHSSSGTSQLKTKGEIKEWKKLRSVKNANGVYTVDVMATVFKYDMDASSSRKKVALLPVEFANGSKRTRQRIEDAIEHELVQTRRFAVLSRADIDKVRSELNFINSDGIQAAERAKLGHLLGGDVLLSVNVDQAYYRETEKYIQVTGQTKIERSGLVKITMKVISAVTGEIKFSESYSKSLSDSINTLQSMINYVAAISVKDLVNRIYPPLVIKVNGDNVFLNIGGKGVKKGQLFKVFSQGEVLIDPYTGEPLGAEEQYIGKLKIVRVESKFSVGEIVDGDGFAAGMIARQSASVKSETPHKQPSAPIQSSSGYKLPFD